MHPLVTAYMNTSYVCVKSFLNICKYSIPMGGHGLNPLNSIRLKDRNGERVNVYMHDYHLAEAF